MKEQKIGREEQNRLTLEEAAALCIGGDFWHIRGVPRLKLPKIMVADGPHGLRKQVEHHDSAAYSDSVPATCFPTASAVACTFDPELAYAMGKAMGEECRREKVSVLLGPGVNMKRSPLCGRNFEYFSEDPYLAGKLAAAMIRGVQSTGVGTALKHFAGNSQETGRLSADSVIDERALREIYLKAFEIAVKEGQPWMVMSAYNRLNGTYCSENRKLLSILREEWGFEGAVVSDWGAVSDICESIRAGLDVEMPGQNNGHMEQLLTAAARSEPLRGALNASAERVVTLLRKAEQGKALPFVCSFEAHHALARRIAEAAEVLLKNDGTLPGKAGQKTAVIGALARKPRYQGSGSSRIHPKQLTTPWDALSDRLPHVVYAPGYGLDTETVDPGLIAEAVETAKEQEIVYLFAGLPEAFEMEGCDRRCMGLPENQRALIEAVCRANPRTVVILQAGSPVEMDWEPLPAAILLACLGGEAGGEAVCRLLLGDCSPCGRLAETIPMTLGDVPLAEEYPGGRVTDYRESIYMGYRFYDAAKKPVRYPFGCGLSYTEFAYRDLKVEKLSGDRYEASCTVENTGNCEGAEVVQLYLGPEQTGGFRAVRQLAGFHKLLLKPGEAKQVSIPFDAAQLAYYSTGRKRWCVERGRYRVEVGASSRDIRLSTVLDVEGEAPETAGWEGLSHYKKVDGTFPKEEFEQLLGHPVPVYTPPRKGQYNENSTLADLSTCRFGRAFLAVLYRCFCRRSGKKGAEMEALWRITIEHPLRSASMAGLSRRQIDAFLALCNGKYGTAVKCLLHRKKE